MYCRFMCSQNKIFNYKPFVFQKADAALSQSRTESLAAAQEAIANEKVEQERAQAMTMLFDAKRENVALQLEAGYREQLMTVYNDVSEERSPPLFSNFYSFFLSI